MLASRLHRLHHTAWHTLRGVWWDPFDLLPGKPMTTINILSA